MVKVSVADSVGFSFRTTIDGIVLRKKLAEPVQVTVRSSLARLSDENLVFVFEETDREELMAISDKTLDLVNRELKSTYSLEELAKELLPTVKKKATAAKKKTTPKEKTTSKAEKSSLAKK